jgi:hypothetical protein
MNDKWVQRKSSMNARGERRRQAKLREVTQVRSFEASVQLRVAPNPPFRKEQTIRTVPVFETDDAGLLANIIIGVIANMGYTEESLALGLLSTALNRFDFEQRKTLVGHLLYGAGMVVEQDEENWTVAMTPRVYPPLVEEKKEEKGGLVVPTTNIWTPDQGPPPA